MAKEKSLIIYESYNCLEGCSVYGGALV
ncbi:hypothetical protein CCACVL1_29317 [Corchorus capsularis]|uniref:Uncharacterized protein n=1 Tax=Corchorus capsularis TaxID=210143 RepID=A0A1R3G291_COCAP|nr:hypothetical protein CCACVL1_29317 [Corchorus capsularis]